MKRRTRAAPHAILPVSVGWGSVAMALTWAVTVACGGGAGRSDGLDAESLPVNVRPDYDVFAQKCSKCHSLARPLQSGVTDDVFWKEYVERMRRQPSSGISPADEVPILRFLHYFSLEQERQRSARGKNP